MSRELELAQKKQDELASIIKNSNEIQNQRPLFHFATPGGWCNDPNGFSQFDDKIHLFYQYNPYSTKWGSIHWGHVISKDMLDWELQPVALAPENEGDCKGCFSGTAIDDNGCHLMAYTGVSNNGKVDIQNQCIASGDGIRYQKKSEKAIITAEDIPFKYNNEHFRDPKLWKKDGVYYMACVIKQLNDCGALILFESQDSKIWKYKGMLDSSKDGLSKMWECPDLLNLDGKDMMILSPQEMKEDYQLGFHNGNNSLYITGTLDYENVKFTREVRPENGYTAAQIDYGIDFYAPETTKLKDGRTILIAWMQSWESYITPENYIWSGMMTIPRELSFKNNRLYQNPIRELEKWKVGQIQGNAEKNEIKVFETQPRHFELDLVLDFETDGYVELFLGNDKTESVSLRFDLSEKSILFDRSKSLTPGAVSFRKAKLEPEGKKMNVRILCDTCSLEVFADDGKIAFTNSFFFTDSNSPFELRNQTSGSVAYSYWKIKKEN